MEILINDVDYSNFQAVITRHGDAGLNWSTSTYAKLKFHDLGRLFKELNAFWATLPEKKQADIFDAYSEIHEALSNVEDHSTHLQHLRAQVKRIYSYYTNEDVDKVMATIDIVYPTTMFDDFGKDGDNGRTYRKSDYKELVHLALRLRPMVPIFGQYVRLVKDYSGTHFKEGAAVGLLYDTDVIEGSPAADKLTQYMNSTLLNFPHHRTAVMGNLGTDEVPYWLTMKALFRRVALGEVDSGSDISSIVTNVYNFVKSQLESLPRNFGSVVRSKNRTNEGSSSTEENISLLESFKIRQSISDGDKVMINHYCQDPFAIAWKVDPTVPEELIASCTRVTGMWASSMIHQHQGTLVKWVLSAAIGPRYFDVIGRESALRCIGATQALLYHWGFVNIASLMTAQPLDDPNIAPMTSLWAREQISKEKMVELRERYPHYKPPTKKDQTTDDTNPGVIGINLIADSVYKSDWVYTGPEWLKEEISFSDVETILIPPNFRDQLATILLQHAT